MLTLKILRILKHSRNVSWDDCKTLVTFGGKCKDSPDSNDTMGVQWEENSHRANICSLYGDCSYFNGQSHPDGTGGCCYDARNGLGTCYSYNKVEQSS